WGRYTAERQLKIDVLPAPFGPMMANSSSCWTSKLTWDRAVTPPKRSVRSVTRSSGWAREGSPSVASGAAVSGPAMVASVVTSRPPALPAPVGLGLAEGAALGRLPHPQVELPDVLVGEQLVPPPVAHDPAVLEHVALVGDRQRHRGVLLDEEDARSLPVDVDDDVTDLLDDLGSQPER